MQKSTSISTDKKRLALQMYLEGLGFNSIGRILHVSHVAVMNWVKRYGKQAEELRSEQEIKIIEMDEMHSYIGSKKTISGFGLLLIDMENDSSTSYWVKGTGLPAKDFGKE
jgi:transposase-like protein